MKTKRVTLGLPIDLYNKISKLAKESNRTIIGQITHMYDYFVQVFKKEG